ncbi:MAG: type IV secretory system conjugative DNA transfer family protein, partial [Rickettsia endosymbiont of Ixodes persulcatus]|nr:type IV secretory system conjugative DNA transfer family protein [Rickettsia endosymbiont of Ixodes persulcatus]
SFPPIKSRKIKYYEDKFFTSRLLPPTFVPTQVPFDPRANNNEDSEETETITASENNE